MDMTEEELRLACLEAALNFGYTDGDVLEVAERFENFVFGSAQDDEPEPEDGAPAPPGDPPCDCVSATPLDTTEPEIDAWVPTMRNTPPGTSYVPPALHAYRH